MNRTGGTRVLLGLVGAGLAAYGGVELLGALRSPKSVVPIGVRWLVGPVLLDLALVPLVAVVAVLLRRRLPGRSFRPVGAASVVSLLVSVVALPFVAGVGRRADNPTLLDRPYLAGWLGILALVWVVAAVSSLLGARRASVRRRRPASAATSG